MTDQFDINKLYEALGYYVSSVAMIEGRLDLIIESEFKVFLPNDVANFRKWISSNLSFRRR